MKNIINERKYYHILKKILSNDSTYEKQEQSDSR